jgi:ribonuclease HI
MYYKMYTDGGSRGNPGKAAIGVVIYDKNNKKIKEISKYIGIATNNVAEYTALLFGVLTLKELQCTKVDMFLDSQLIVRQLNGQYKVKDHKMRNLYKKIIENIKGIDWVVEHVKREKNKVADQLVNDALDALNAL